jgi:hypothetical protein
MVWISIRHSAAMWIVSEPKIPVSEFTLLPLSIPRGGWIAAGLILAALLCLKDLWMEERLARILVSLVHLSPVDAHYQDMPRRR